MMAIGAWHWLALALLLMGAELLVPGVFLLWLGIAAVPVGLLLLLAPDIGLTAQLLLFGVLALAVIAAVRRWSRRAEEPALHPTLNRRGQSYVGRSFVLEEPIVNGQGRLRVDDGVWRVQGADQPAGVQVTVTGANGTVLTVKSD